MSWNLFLDDERDPIKTYGQELGSMMLVARNSDQAEMFVLTNGMPDFIGFDHDLGEIKTGHYFANWLIEQDLNGTHTFPDNFSFNVHSANPVGAKNIQGVLDRYLQHKRDCQQILADENFLVYE
jgi:hypothetical protein